MRIAITGACGFIGSDLVKRLNNLGYEVIYVDHVDKHNGDKNFYDWKELTQTKRSFIAKCDFIFHLGANSSTRSTYEELQDPNERFSRVLLQHAKQVKIPVVFASSGAVYGTDRRLWNRARPLTKYGLTKFRTEQLINRNHKKEAVCLRYHNVYGAGESHKNDMASIVSKYIDGYLLHEKSHLLFENSEHIFRDFIHVQDVNDINIMFLDFYLKFKQLPNMPIFDVGTGKPVSFQQVANEIVKYTKLPIQYIPNPYNRKNYQFYTRANTIKIRNLHRMVYEEPFKPLTIEEGIKQVFDEKLDLHNSSGTNHDITLEGL